MALSLLTDIDPAYGEATRLSPLVRRVVCNNPGRFTFTGTGTYLVGSGDVAVIDPGPLDSEHVSRLMNALAGETVSHILLTHTHADHSPAAAELSDLTGAPIWGFGPHPVVEEASREAATPSTWHDLMPTPAELDELVASMPNVVSVDQLSDQEEHADTDLRIDAEVRDGDLVTGPGWTLEALHTPGHISNHLCYRLHEGRAVFTGDHIMGWSTSVIPSPEGSMSDYMASLERLISADDDTYYPTHGPPIGEPASRPRDFASALHEHRQGRENQILARLDSSRATIPEMVTSMYQAVPHILHMAAGQSVYSHLVHMADRGLITTEAGSVTADATFVRVTL